MRILIWSTRWRPSLTVSLGLSARPPRVSIGLSFGTRDCEAWVFLWDRPHWREMFRNWNFGVFEWGSDAYRDEPVDDWRDRRHVGGGILRPWPRLELGIEVSRG